MTGPIPDAIVEEVRARADIVEIVGEHVPLKRAGKDYRGLCPFHQEKTPSFYVVPAKGFYKCFGCGESGDVVAFVMKHLGMGFDDAVRAVAARVGIPMAEDPDPEVSVDEASELDYNKPDLLVAPVAELFERAGCAREVAVLTHARAHLQQTGYDNWDGGIWSFRLVLQVPIGVYAQLGSDIPEIERAIADKVKLILRSFPQDHLDEVLIAPELKVDSDWRERARTWLRGEGVTNQGRVRSTNIAPKTCDGLLFRSGPEIELYKALKARGVTFAPLPVFIRGGRTYQRIEPDFVIIKDGIVLVVEVDGDTVHTETPAEAHARTTMLAHEGVYIERVSASECATPGDARRCADRLLEIMARYKATR